MGLLTTSRQYLVILLLLLCTDVYGAAIKGLDEGTTVAYCKEIDFVGSNIALTASGLNCTLTESVSGGGDFLANGSVPMTAEIFIDAAGAEFEPGDALTDCSTFAATGGGIFYDDSEGKFKKCQDNTLSDLDTNSGGATAYDDIGDPDAATTIAFDDTETVTWDSDSDGETFFSISLGDTDLAGDTIGLLITTVDDDDTNYIPLRIADDSGVNDDTLFLIDSTGAITTGILGANVTGSTASANDNDTSISTTAFVQQEINGAGGTGLTCGTGTCNVDLGTGIAASEMDDEDHGDVSWSSGVATVENVQCTDCIAGSEIPDDQLDSEHYVANSVDDEHLATTDYLVLHPQSAKISGGFVTGDPTINGGAEGWELKLDTGSDDSVLWEFIMPPNYTTDTLDVIVKYKMSGSNCNGTTTVVGLEVDLMAVADGESAVSASFDTVNDVAGGTVCPGTVDLVDTITFSNINDDGLSAGELVFLRVIRDVDDDDDASDDVEIVGVIVQWTR